MSIQVLPRASPTVTHLMNLAALVPIAARRRPEPQRELHSARER
ncbi:unnamed protein product [Spirodela intermedia]|uniref:Uncharacterized protein n=1 Tax=Spirodela intermedia TaxID=51605 RepID=A0A7I8JIV6_SPIIN|nr:unnamed protein product [Spirodela intermedia]CAA6670069.1 unnamed protein product [Spirodela intermedia]